jgi:predicted oxidoreductase
MQKKLLHRSGLECSRIIAGAWRWNTVSPAIVEKLMKTSIDAGITTFDHADIYGDYNNEKIFGDVLKMQSSLRQKIQLITKCGIKLLSGRFPGTWIKHYDTTKDHIIRSVDQSLSNLGTDHIDLLLIHRPDPLMDPREVAETFGVLKENGKVIHFGVSNFTNSQFEVLQSALPFPLVTNQIEVSLSKPQALSDGTLDMLMKYGVCPMAWSPLGGGKLMDPQSSLWGKKSKYNATEAQLSLAWLLRHPSNIFPVIGTTQPDRIIESAAAMQVVLDRQDWFEMLRVATGKDVA